MNLNNKNTNVVPIVIVGLPTDPLPDDIKGAVILYHRTNGESWIRWYGTWMKQSTKHVGAELTSVSTILAANVLKHINFPTFCKTKPTISAQAWLASDTTISAPFTITNKTTTGFDVKSRFDCLFEFTYGEPVFI
jgi:hypothetical protein